MKPWVQHLVNLDRRVIYVLIFFAILLPFLVEFPLPIEATKNVKNIYNKIEKVHQTKGSEGRILLSFDFDNASQAELVPMVKAILAHVFSRDMKVAIMGHWPNGVELGKEVVATMAKEYNKEYGKDYVFLGYRPGVSILIINMGNDFKSAYAKDVRGNKVGDLEVTKKINTIKDFDYVISFSAGSGGIEEWVIYGQSKFRFDLGGACTAVMAPDFFPFLQTGQLNGLIGGLTGAAEYEVLVNRPEDAIKGMRPQSIAHIVLILFIVLGNIFYFVERRQKALKGAAQ